MRTCSICRENYSTHACSAFPVTERDCCERCDDLVVTPLRIAMSLGYSTVLRLFQDAIIMREQKQKLRKKLAKTETSVGKSRRTK
jgi:hypothetical protein